MLCICGVFGFNLDCVKLSPWEPMKIRAKMAGGGSDFLGKCRSRRCELGLLQRADGSARFQQGTGISRS